MTDYELTKLEENAIQIINEKDLVYQNELYKLIDCSSGHGSKIARKLAEKELIIRDKDESGKYILKRADKDPKDLNYNLLMSGNMLSPFIGEDEVDIHSDRFTKWLMNLPDKK
jgi:hypothetical protein